MNKLIKRLLSNVIGFDTIKLFFFQVVEKIAPVVSLWIVSQLFEVKSFDTFALILISVSTIVSWSTSGIGVAATKAAFRDGNEEMESLNSLSYILSLLTSLIFVIFSIVSNEFTIFNLLITLSAGHFASKSVLKKSIQIANFNWKVLFNAYVLGLLALIVSFLIFFKLKIEFPELGLFIYYLILSRLLNIKISFKLKLKVKTLRYFYKELGPLYLTGIISGSMIFVLTMIAIGKNNSEGITGMIAIAFQAISILQFLPMAMNRVFLVLLSSGKKLQVNFEIFKLSVFILLAGFLGFLILPILKAEFNQLSLTVYLLVILASWTSTLSTFFGNILVVNGKTILWTYISFVSNLIGVLIMYFVNNTSILELLYVSLIITYFIQFILGKFYNEKYRFLHI